MEIEKHQRVKKIINRLKLDRIRKNSKKKRLEKKWGMQEFEKEMSDTYWAVKILKEELQKNLDQQFWKKIPTNFDIKEREDIVKQLEKEKKTLQMMVAIWQHVKHPRAPLQRPLNKIFSDAKIIQEDAATKKTFNDFIEQQREKY